MGDCRRQAHLPATVTEQCQREPEDAERDLATYLDAMQGPNERDAAEGYEASENPDKRCSKDSNTLFVNLQVVFHLPGTNASMLQGRGTTSSS